MPPYKKLGNISLRFDNILKRTLQNLKKRQFWVHHPEVYYQ